MLDGRKCRYRLIICIYVSPHQQIENVVAERLYLQIPESAQGNAHPLACGGGDEDKHIRFLYGCMSIIRIQLSSTKTASYIFWVTNCVPGGWVHGSCTR